MHHIIQHKKIIQHKNTVYSTKITELDNFLEKLSTLFETELTATIK